MMNKRNIRIEGMGIYLPKRIVPSSEIDKIIGAKEGWSEKKAGVKTRHFVEGETASFMGAEAAKKAVEKAGLTFSDIDCIISSSGTTEQAIPCTASLIQEQLGLQQSGIPCFDINSTCLSFLTALDTISYAMIAGRYKRVVLVSTEIASVGLNWKQDESSILFGDGAVATVISASESNSGIITSHMETYSEGAHLSEIRGGGTRLHPRTYSEETKENFLFDMNGTRIFKLSSKLLPNFLTKLLEGTGYSIQDMDMVIPHQASAAAMKIIRRKLGVDEDKFMSIIENHGNMIAASLPMALYRALEDGKVKRGSKVMLIGTSAGLSLGGMVLEY